MDFLHPCENDALLVDDLLDFSCGDIGEGDDYLVTCVRGKEKDSNSASISSVEETLLRRPSQEASEPGDCLYSLVILHLYQQLKLVASSCEFVLY